jgi:hypothetical protein
VHRPCIAFCVVVIVTVVVVVVVVVVVAVLVVLVLVVIVVVEDELVNECSVSIVSCCRNWKVPTFWFLQQKLKGGHLPVFAAEIERWAPSSFCSRN